MAEEWVPVCGSGAKLYYNDPRTGTWKSVCDSAETVYGKDPITDQWIQLCCGGSYAGPGSGTGTGWTPPPDSTGGGGDVGGGGGSGSGGDTGGSPGTDGTVMTTNALPWDLLTSYSTAKPVMAHYFTQFPLRHSNAATPSYYINNWLKPGAIENGTDHRVYGGWLRDIPFNRPVLGSDWKLQDMRQEIQWALDAKIDGFFVDMLSIDTNSAHWTNLMLLFQASDAEFAASGRRCWIAPMPDGTAGPCNASISGTTVNISASATTLVNAILRLKDEAALWKPWGKFVLPIFGPEKFKSGITNPDSDRITYWTKVKNDLTAASMPTDLWACYVDSWTAPQCAPAFNSIVIGHGRWGGRDDVDTGSTNNNNGGAAEHCHTTFNRKWMHFGSPGDTRPRDKYPSGTNYQGYRVWEPRGTKTLHNTMTAAINGADMTQLTTWNDYSEHAHIVPSRNNSYVWVDLLTYYIVKYKTGDYPRILRDGLYMVHRVHPYAKAHSTFTGVQSKFAIHVGATAQLDIVEVRAFLTAAATVEFLVNGTVTDTRSVPAGDTRMEFALPATGVVSARVKRNNVVVDRTTVTSSITLGGAQVADDFHPRCFSSLRQIDAPPPPPPSTGGGAPGTLLFEDNFNGTSIDTTKWNVRTDYQSNHNGRNFARNCSVHDGMLSIRSGTDNNIDPGAHPWTCGYLDTIGKFSVKTGRFEARLRMPMGPTAKGYWPAFWLRPDGGGIGEIDIMEAWANRMSMHQSLWRDYDGTPHVENSNKASAYDPTQWHVYAVEKTSNTLRFFIDNVQVWDATHAATWVTEAIFRDVKWHIRVQLQIGGSYEGTPDGGTNLSQTYDIDYVRVYAM